MIRKYDNYPESSLGPQYREFKDTPSLYTVLLEHFKKEVEKLNDPKSFDLV